jgi:hypothetical protein
MTERRSFFASLLSLLGVPVPPAAPPPYAVPRWVVRQYGLSPIDDVKGFGVPADRVWLHGQDGRHYRLSDVIAGLFKVK